MTAHEIVSRFEDAKETPNGWQAKCPAHDDRQASLSVNTDDPEKVLLHCHAGCSVDAVCLAAGLKVKDLFLTKGRHSNGHRSNGTAASKSRRSTLANKRIVAEYDYRDESGELVFQAVRLEPKDFRCRRRVVTGTSAGWVWNMDGVRKVPYRLPEVRKAIEECRQVFIVEGEKDVGTLEGLGITATCNAGGAGKWLKSYSPYLAGADVVILPDNDNPGREHAESVAKALQGHAGRIRVLRLPELPPKGDVSDWVEHGGNLEDLTRLVESTPDWEPAPEDDITLGLDGEPLNDLGNARRLVKQYGKTIRWCCDAGKWYVWDNTRWNRDETGELARMAKTIVDGMFELAAQTKTQAEKDADTDRMDAAKAFERHAVASGNHRRILAMISQAESEPGVPVLASALDADSWVFNCQNGTIDLRTGQLRPHDPTDLISKLSPIAFDPDAACPTWESFLRDIFQSDDELIRFVQSAAGYTLTGDTREQVFFILHGCGSNGKSTFLNTLRDIFGDYETKTSTDTLIERDSSATNGLAALRGARFVNATESSAGKRLAEALVKELTGQDTVSARFLYQEFFTFVPTFKLWLACNHVPLIQGQDHGMWRRVRLIPFGVQFRDPDDDTGPYKDKTLPDRLKAEHEGILAWLVRGCLEWQRGGLPGAEAVRFATGQLQNDLDVLGGFLTEHCYFDKHAETPAKSLYDEYCQWAEKNGEKPLTPRWFGVRLKERGACFPTRTTTTRKWRGIGLLSEKPAVLSLEDYDTMTDSDTTSREVPMRARESVHENSDVQNQPLHVEVPENSVTSVIASLDDYEPGCEDFPQDTSDDPDDTAEPADSSDNTTDYDPLDYGGAF